jgi:putative NADH-flavin reductase
VRVLIIGASKGIGLETTRQALDAGHDVRAFARSATAIAISNPSLEKMPGDALKLEDVEAALVGVDVVIQTLGVGLGDLIPACAPVLGRDPSADRGNETPRC